MGGGGGLASGRFDQISLLSLDEEAGLAIEDASFVERCHSRFAPSSSRLGKADLLVRALCDRGGDLCE